MKIASYSSQNAILTQLAIFKFSAVWYRMKEDQMVVAHLDSIGNGVYGIRKPKLNIIDQPLNRGTMFGPLWALLKKHYLNL